jgi:hypothetical protein
MRYVIYIYIYDVSRLRVNEILYGFLRSKNTDIDCKKNLIITMVLTMARATSSRFKAQFQHTNSCLIQKTLA